MKEQEPFNPSRVQFITGQLRAQGQELFSAWLGQATFSSGVAMIQAESGHHVLVVDGQSQASRRNPLEEAHRWLEKLDSQGVIGEAGPLTLFGLGNPYLVTAALSKYPGRQLWVFEPNPTVLLGALAISPKIFPDQASAPIQFLCPWHLAEDQGPVSAALMVHPASQRREPASLAALKRYLNPSRLGQLMGPKPRLMIVPPLSGGSWPVASSLAKAARQEGHELWFMDWSEELKGMEYLAHQRAGNESTSLIAEIFRRTGSQAAEKAGMFQPDLIIALAQAPLDLAGLEAIRRSSAAHLAFWLVEDYRVFDYVGELLPAYDSVFHIQPGLIEPVLRNWGISKAYYLPLAADPDIFRPDLTPRAGFAAELSFMGAGYPNRRAILSDLAENFWPRTGRPRDNFKIFGSGWAGVPAPLKDHLFAGGRRVNQEECAQIYAQGLVNLNLHSSFNQGPDFAPESRFVNPRTFEIAASGSLQIVDRRPLLPPLFQEGHEVVTAESPQSLPDLIDYYLGNYDEARAIGQAARRRVLAEHTYGHRLKFLLDCLV